MPAKGVFPTRENCDLDDPEEMFLWMFAALPGVNGGQFIMPIDYWRLVSKRLYELGARIGAEPGLEYVPPAANEPNWATSAGKWVEAGTVTSKEKDERQATNALAMMGHQQRVELRKALDAWKNGGPMPPTMASQVVDTLKDDQRLLIMDILKSDSA